MKALQDRTTETLTELRTLKNTYLPQDANRDSAKSALSAVQWFRGTSLPSLLHSIGHHFKHPQKMEIYSESFPYIQRISIATHNLNNQSELISNKEGQDER
jgi:hypothetical protein